MEFVHVGFWPSLWATVLLALVLLLCGRAGGAVLFALGIPKESLTLSEIRLFSIGVGIILLALGILVVGSFVFLNYGSVLALIGLLIVVPLLLGKRNLFSFQRTIAQNGFSKGRLLFWLLLVGVLALSWFQALTPPIGNDALAYHLAHPKEFILQGKVSYLPLTRESLWPYQTEMLYTLGLLFQGTGSAQLFHWAFYGLTALAIYVLGRRFYAQGAAFLAVLVFIFTPAVFTQSGQAYVDLSLAFFIFIAFYAFLLQGEIGQAKAALLSGVLCGGALATKYLALGPAAFLLLFWMIQTRCKGKACLLFVAGCAAVAGVWYLRSWVIIGNPVYPFLPQIFNGNGFESQAGRHVGMGKDLISVALFGWNITMHPQRFGGEAVGPLYLAFLPFLAFQLRGARGESRWLLLFVFTYFTFLFFQSQHARFIISLLPFLAVGAGVSLDFLLKRGALAKIASGSILVLTILAHSGWFVYHGRHAWVIASGRMPFRDYLARFERSYQGYSYLKEHVRKGERVFNAGEVRRFYNEIPGTLYDTEAWRVWLKKKGWDPVSYFQTEYFDYIWLEDSSDKVFFEYVAKNGYKEAFSYSFTEGAATYRHSIYKRIG